MSKIKTTEQFIKDAKMVHGDKYDYSKVDYKGNKIKVCIICPKHGEFWQTPNSHLNGSGCKKCYDNERSNKISKDTKYFIEKARKIHGDYYDYSKVEYVNAKSEVCIICPKHGEFWQKPNTHLNGNGCKECGKEKVSNLRKDDINSFINKAKKIHLNKYDYSKVKYVDTYTKVCIICPIHGEFWQKPNAHLNGNGCPLCAKNHKMDANIFIERAKKVHGDYYDYSKVKYVNARTKVCIICPIHGEFWQKPSDHLNKKCGCPICKQSHLERDTRDYLTNNKINFEQEKRFDWLGRMSLDFYLPDYGIAIECQGQQHFMPINFFGKSEKYADSAFDEIKKRDKLKKELCTNNSIEIVYVNYWENVIEQLNKNLKIRCKLR